jgi:hypothetical protein
VLLVGADEPKTPEQRLNQVIVNRRRGPDSASF